MFSYSDEQGYDPQYCVVATIEDKRIVVAQFIIQHRCRRAVEVFEAAKDNGELLHDLMLVAGTSPAKISQVMRLLGFHSPTF